ncbi:hypothetical protein GCM10017674_66340 [Streptomyces gardneri]|nr:hypothetical protein GCM10017674_66340 [Streptomyces gardneri]
MVGTLSGSWVADMIRRSRAHPAAFFARSVTRSGASATCRPPWTGVRRWGAAAGEGLVRGDGEVDAEDGPDTGGRGGLREAHRAGHVVAVGQRQRSDPALRGPGSRSARLRGAEAGRNPTRHMQMRHPVTHDNLRITPIKQPKNPDCSPG